MTLPMCAILLADTTMRRFDLQALARQALLSCPRSAATWRAFVWELRKRRVCNKLYRRYYIVENSQTLFMHEGS